VFDLRFELLPKRGFQRHRRGCFSVCLDQTAPKEQRSKKAMLVPALPAVDAYARCLEQSGQRQQRTGAPVRPFQRHRHQREQRGAEQACGDCRVAPNPGGDPGRDDLERHVAL